ncbi:MAG TPA: class II fructose-1,6-bisphosphate aldolase [Thermoanaerobacterales bacterium]|nr:class II fructose-1,6-bisphosphate aldolase [Thermoanaerobacterales bacterium]
MSLVTLTDILKKAEEGRYAVGAFNCNNMEIVKSIANAAKEENAPVIIQASQGAINYAGLNYITALVETAALETDVPIVLHLDHGTDLEQIIKCIRFGFTSVMIDGSMLPYEENLKITKKVVEIAKAVGVSVEAELGRIGGTEDNIHVSEKDVLFTDPEEARVFVEETGVDALAIAIGTAHGQYKGEPELDFDRLKEIAEKVSCPLVLHGSSGVPDESIKKAIELGIRKVNIDTNIRESFVGSVREFLNANPKEIDPRKVLAPAQEKATDVIREKIRIFGSSGMA